MDRDVRTPRSGWGCGSPWRWPVARSFLLDPGPSRRGRERRPASGRSRRWPQRYRSTTGPGAGHCSLERRGQGGNRCHRPRPRRTPRPRHRRPGSEHRPVVRPGGCLRRGSHHLRRGAGVRKQPVRGGRPGDTRGPRQRHSRARRTGTDEHHGRGGDRSSSTHCSCADTGDAHIASEGHDRERPCPAEGHCPSNRGRRSPPAVPDSCAADATGATTSADHPLTLGGFDPRLLPAASVRLSHAPSSGENTHFWAPASARRITLTARPTRPTIWSLRFAEPTCATLVRRGPWSTVG